MARQEPFDPGRGVLICLGESVVIQPEVSSPCGMVRAH